MPIEPDLKQQSFAPCRKKVPTPNIFNRDRINLPHTVHWKHWLSLCHPLNRQKFKYFERKWGFFEGDRDCMGVFLFVCFLIMRVNFLQNTMQMDSNENPGHGHWNPGLFALNSIIKRMSVSCSKGMLITKSFHNKVQTRLLSIKSKIRMKCSHQCPKFHYPIATIHYSFFQFNFFLSRSFLYTLILFFFFAIRASPILAKSPCPRDKIKSTHLFYTRLKYFYTHNSHPCLANFYTLDRVKCSSP